jgi:transketolase
MTAAYQGFLSPELAQETVSSLQDARRRAAADIVRLTSLATCGHPGGSLSSLDALLVLYAGMQHRPTQPDWEGRDRVVVSHGHISPGVYSTLALHDYFPIEEAWVGFRREGSVFGGHVERVVPGVEWNTGNLGQGLSAGAGFAMANRIHGIDARTFVLMGDGEQQKGQIGEARRFAAKFGLTSLVALIDVNGLQIGGRTDDIMPFDLAGDWRADGWEVVEVDGHDLQALHQALHQACHHATRPTVLLLQTVMGKGIPFIENLHKYHGQALSDAQAREAFALLGQPDNLVALRALRAERDSALPHHVPSAGPPVIATGVPRTWGPDEKTDCRSAYGLALADLARANHDQPGHWPIVGISCDLEGSVKMNDFRALTPDRFLETGIQEHHAAVLTGAMSTVRTVPFYSTFGMFAVVEGYNQQRLNDQNEAAPRVVVTHCGLDVGEDGPTHQCIDYVALMRNLFGWECYLPADPNETDRIVRTVATRQVPSLVAMGRSKLPTLCDRTTGTPIFGGDHTFTPGVWTEVRPGADAVVFATGCMVYRAVEASDRLHAEGFGLRVVNASSVKPFDRACIVEAARLVPRLLTYEDHHRDTGLGALVGQVLVDEGIPARLTRLGVSRYSTSGPPDALFAAQGLSPADLMEAARGA